jgi:hypothetical protein
VNVCELRVLTRLQVCAVLTWRFAPESPRYLLVHGRGGEALAVLRAAAARNGRPDALPPGATLRAPPQRSSSSSSSATTSSSDVATALRDAGAAAATSLRAALSPPLRATTLPMCAVWFGISWGWYGTVLWFPVYFAQRNKAADAGDSVSFAPPPPLMGTTRPAPLDARPFADQLAVALANLPGNALSLVLIDRLGRRATLAASLVAGALAALAFAFVPRRAAGAALAAACAFNGASVGAWNALDTYSAELMPTSVRTTGLGLMSAAGRMGAIAAQLVNGRLLEVSLAAPLLPGAAIMFLVRADCVVWCVSCAD